MHGGAVYLDAESYRTVIENSVIDTTGTTPDREGFSVDGSSGNLIINNRFVRPLDGAFFITPAKAGTSVALTASCREHDANGGDCAIKGELYCR